MCNFYELPILEPISYFFSNFAIKRPQNIKNSYFFFKVVEDGYEFFAKRQLVTLFSAPNYCGEFDNAGGMMSVDETLMCSFQVSMLNNDLAKKNGKKQNKSNCYVALNWLMIRKIFLRKSPILLLLLHVIHVVHRCNISISYVSLIGRYLDKIKVNWHFFVWFVDVSKMA